MEQPTPRHPTGTPALHHTGSGSATHLYQLLRKGPQRCAVTRGSTCPVLIARLDAGGRRCSKRPPPAPWAWEHSRPGQDAISPTSPIMRHSQAVRSQGLRRATQGLVSSQPPRSEALSPLCMLQAGSLATYCHREGSHTGKQLAGQPPSSGVFGCICLWEGGQQTLMVPPALPLVIPHSGLSDLSPLRG